MPDGTSARSLRRFQEYRSPRQRALRQAADDPSISAVAIPEQIADDEAELRRQLDQLGLKRCDFQDESLAPPVDERVLRRLIRRELPEKTAELLYRRIYSFRSWHEAHTRLWIEEYPRGIDE